MECMKLLKLHLAEETFTLVNEDIKIYEVTLTELTLEEAFLKKTGGMKK